MRYILFKTLFFLFTLIACNQSNKKQFSKSNSLLTPQLIQTCIDSTLALDPGLNTGSFLLDMNLIYSIDGKVFEEFRALNSTIKFVNSDSLIATDSTWIKYQFFQNPLIRFDKIDFDGNQIIINTSKTKASDGSIRTKIIFIKKGNHYECIESRITTIS